MPGSPLTLTQRLAAHVCGLAYADLPDVVIRKLKAVVLHDVALMFLGLRTEEGQLALNVVKGGLGPLGRSTVLGQLARTSAIDAAFANAVMAHAPELDDHIVPSFVQPGALIIPAVLAVGEQEACSGREVIVAVAAGYDVVGRVAGSTWTWARDRIPTHVFGSLGVAAAVARLLRLDPEQTAIALAYAADSATVITQGFASFQYGLIVRNGITAAELGRSRAPAPTDALEGPGGLYATRAGGVPGDLEKQLSSLRKSFDVSSAVVRPNRFSALNLVPLYLLRVMAKEFKIGAADVESVVVHRPRDFGAVPNAHSVGPFYDPNVALASLPFAIAAMLLDGDLTEERLERADDPALVELARKVRVDLVDEADRTRHRVEISAAGGREHGASGDMGVLTTPETLPFLVRAATPVIGSEKAKTLGALLNALEYASSLELVAAGLRP